MELYPAARSFIDNGIATEREVCLYLGFARPAFQRWSRLTPSFREQDNARLCPMITSIFYAHKRRYGTRRIAAELRDEGLSVGRRRISKLMKHAGIAAIQPKSVKPKTTDSRHRLGYNENLILNLQKLQAPNQLWVADISYIPVLSLPFAYLAILLDRYSRMIVAWQLRKDMTEQLVIEALANAIRTRQPNPGLIHHSDRGGQYAAKAYRQMLSRAGIKQSMNRADECYDNAFMESCFGTIKSELQMTEYQNYSTANKEITSYINYYNFQRKHSAINYQTPYQFELSTKLN
jgi:transposase InsO family protein